MIDVRFRPLTVWPGESLDVTERHFGPFKSSYSQTLAKLDKELRKLEARDTVIEVTLSSLEIRIDGWPRAGASPRDPSVVISFSSKYGPLRLYTDWFRKYEHNIHAIALHLERLRLAALYGVGTRGEQYKGYAQIERARSMTVEEAGAFIGNWDRDVDVLSSRDTMVRAYRKAAMVLHPDKGGVPALWHKLQEASDVLEQFFLRKAPR